MTRSRKAKSSSDEENLRDGAKLEAKHQFILAKLETLENRVANATSAEQEEIAVVLEEAQSLLTQYEDSYLAVMRSEEEGKERRARENFYDRYCNVMAKGRALKGTEAPAASQYQVATQGVRLPKIKLPTFDGSNDWLTYYDSFNSLIHNCKSLPNVQKYQYLLSSLSGEARKVVENLPITNDNYEIAWETLTSKYNKQKVIIRKYIRELLHIPKVDKTHFDLSKFETEARKLLRVLQQADLPWGAFLTELLSEKLDPSSRFEWERINNDNENILTLEEFLEFVRKRGDLMGATKNLSTKNPTPPVKALVTTSSCPLCRDSHNIFRCKKFESLSPVQRFNTIRNKGLCTNCLKAGHQAKECTAGECKKCHLRHHTLLHKERDEGVEITEESTVPQITAHSSSGNSTLLATTLIKVADKRGRYQTFRALLDSGSQSNFITVDSAKKLGLKLRPTMSCVEGLGQLPANLKGETDVVIRSQVNNFTTTQRCLVLKTITNPLPAVRLNVDKIPIPKGVKLADPEFHSPGPVHMLLGSSIFWELLCVGQIKLGKGLPILQKTKLGWIISGQIPARNCKVTRCILARNQELDEGLKAFWQLEECQTKPSLTTEEQICVNNFLENTKRADDGAFVIKLPFKDEYPPLGDSYYNSLKRFHQLERKFKGNPQFKESYVKFMREYQELGHMQEIEQNDISSAPNCYLPHHGVVKEDSATTKLRVVFDASSKTTSGNSLNDTLMVGPTLQDDLFDILLRFRTHRVAISADVEKMYRQIRVHPSHQDFQRILWRENPDEPIRHFRLTTVTYGTASAPYLAVQCLRQTGAEHAAQYPSAAEVIKRDFYVDDLLTGAEDIDEAGMLIKELQVVLSKGNFTLRKWATSDRDCLSELRVSNRDVEHLVLEGEELKTLGLIWNATKDSWGYRVSSSSCDPRITKRSMLAAIARIFDPLGFLGPITIKAKMLIQILWQDKLGWDESVPAEVYTSWKRLTNNLQLISHISIPRQILVPNAIDIQCHGFCDASEKAYGAVLYMRSRDSKGKIVTRLLCAKSRLAPLKTISLPRLELCGALLLARLVARTTKLMKTKVSQTFYWSDSTVALNWIRSEPNKWKTFIGNRVSEIHQISSMENWLHVKGNSNPADIISRGANPQELIKNELWWKGPAWISEEYEDWKSFTPEMLDVSVLPEVRKSSVSLLSTNQGEFTASDLCNKFSSPSKVQRILAYVNRFRQNAGLAKDARCIGPLTIEELRHSQRVLVKLVQGEVFAKELHQLKGQGAVERNSNIARLLPFLDESNIIRVGGRLQQAHIPFSNKHPILLPHKHPFTQGLITEQHVRSLHLGPTALLARLREKYWIVSGLNAVKAITKKCVVCFRADPKLGVYQMGNLPVERVTPSRPFLISGVDFAGPFQVKVSKLRNAKVVNVYLALFVCMSSKAVHLELVNDLTTNAFLASLKRFIARRGMVSQIHSDNGLNFVGANNYLRDLKKKLNCQEDENEFREYLRAHEIEWHFTPPRSPHFGGLWESLIKSVKTQLRKVVGSITLQYEELLTIITEIEACLNSRPITPMSSDPCDLSALTPGHFLIGEALSTIPEGNIQPSNLHSLSRYQLLIKLRRDFWKRWSCEYLNLLQPRQKWGKKGENIKLNALVLVKDENAPPLKWLLGRVTKVYEGCDGVIRVVDVKTSKGTYKRNIRCLAPLPID